MQKELRCFFRQEFLIHTWCCGSWARLRAVSETRRMAEKKRRWLQLHLSTAIVLMFVAGGLLGVNLSPRRCVYSLPEIGAGAVALTTYYGWPKVIYVSGLETEESAIQAYYAALSLKREEEYQLPYVSMDGTVSYTAAIINALFAVGVVVALAVACEWLLRWRERQQP
jgi:hypothetical protein